MPFRWLLGRAHSPAWPTHENPSAAWRVAGASRIERTGNLQVLDQRDAIHVLQIEVSCERLERFIGFGGVASNERDADVPRAGLDVDTFSESSVQRIFRNPKIRIGELVVVFSAHRRQKHADAVDRDLELMWPLEPWHVTDDVLQEADAEVVVGIQWEVVTNEQASSCAERQAFNVILLESDRAARDTPGSLA